MALMSSSSASVDHIRLQAIDHGARLRAGAAMRLLDGHGLAGLLFPVFDEFGVVSAIQPAGRVVGHVEQRAGLGLRRNRQDGRQDQSE